MQRLNSPPNNVRFARRQPQRFAVAAVLALLLAIFAVVPVPATGQVYDASGETAPRTQTTGIAARFDPHVPIHVRAQVDRVLAQFDSVFAFREGAIQIRVGWKVLDTLGLGGPVLVERDDGYYPAALADTLFGGQHAQGDVDGFVTMASNQPWHYGAGDVPADRYDFGSAFAHELVHALGFTVETSGNQGVVTLSGRTPRMDQLLLSGGRRLVDMSPAEQSAAFTHDDVWVDVGGGRLVPLNSHEGRAISHFGNALSVADGQPGSLMYSGLVAGVKHSLDSPVIGVLEGIGYEVSGAPSAPVNVRLEGSTVQWDVVLSEATPPPTTIRVTTYAGGALVSSAAMSGAIEQYVAPGSADLVEVHALSASGQSASMELAVNGLAMAQADSLSALVAADDYRTEYGDVLRLYWAFFNREPDVDGARYWISLFNDGSSLGDIATAFAGSGEFNQRYGVVLSNERYLEVIYLNVLGRERDNDGFSYWLGLLDSGALSRGEIVRWVAAATEFIGAHPY